MRCTRSLPVTSMRWSLRSPPEESTPLSGRPTRTVSESDLSRPRRQRGRPRGCSRRGSSGPCARYRPRAAGPGARDARSRPLDELDPISVEEPCVGGLMVRPRRARSVRPDSHRKTVRRRIDRAGGATVQPVWGYHASRIFQKLFLRTILPSSPNVQMSHPRTSTRTPSTVVPLIVHSETPRFPQAK